MDFELNADERALTEATRSFCEGRFPMKTLRELIGEGGVRRELWKELADTGVFSLRVPTQEGGAGLGMTEAVLVYEELGRALVPGPLVATHLAADLIEGAAEGEVVVGMVELGRSPILVEHRGALDVLLALNSRGELVRCDAGDLPAGELPNPFDPLTPVTPVGGPIEGSVVATRTEAGRLVRRAEALMAALSAGIAARTVELGVDYARERYQFGRPIGSFQAVKHILADAATRTEVARAAVHAAGVVLDEVEERKRSLDEVEERKRSLDEVEERKRSLDEVEERKRSLDDPGAGYASDSQADRAVAAAKLLADDAAVANARACLQVHGGMGFTWEVDVHLYLKRALVLASQFGTPKEMAERMAGYVR